MCDQCDKLQEKISHYRVFLTKGFDPLTRAPKRGTLHSPTKPSAPERMLHLAQVQRQLAQVAAVFGEKIEHAELDFFVVLARM
jgi:hypothetical protein